MQVMDEEVLFPEEDAAAGRMAGHAKSIFRLGANIQRRRIHTCGRSSTSKILWNPKKILIPLHARGKNQPHDFIHTDLEQAALGDKSGANTSAFLNGYRMLFHNRENSDTYGELV